MSVESTNDFLAASTNDLRTLEDRIIEITKDEILFTKETIAELLTNESDRNLYRALNKLEETGRIKFTHWQNRKKVYTTRGTSKIPSLSTLDGQLVPLRAALKGIDSSYVGTDWKTLDSLNELLPDILLLFQIAQIDDKDEMRRSYIEVKKRINKHHAVLNNILSWVDIIQKHPILSGDLDYFKAAFTDPNDPGVAPVDEIIEFKRWYSKFKAARNENN